MKHLTLFLILCLPFSLLSQKKVPAFEEVLSLKSAGTPVLSPDGQHMVYTMRQTDWTDNGYDTEIWLKKAGQEPFQLTNNPDGSSSNPQWSPDGKWVSFTSNRGEKSQVHAIRIDGGEAIALTHEDESIGNYAWSPDGKRIAFTRYVGDEDQEKEREKRYGAYAVDDGEYKLNWLYAVEVDPYAPSPTELPCYDPKDSTAQEWDCIEWPAAEALIDSVEYTIRGFEWSPDGTKIAITHTPDPLINSFFDADISILDVASGEVQTVVKNPSADNFLAWSPDSKTILYTSDIDNRTSNYYKNSRYFRQNLETGIFKELGADFDENLSGLMWTETGIYARAYQKTIRPLFKMDPNSGAVTEVLGDIRDLYGFDVTRDGKTFALSGAQMGEIGELYTWMPGSAPQQFTNFNTQIADWRVAQSEVISWQSKDGATIEGVLHKPDDYDPAKKYPLFVVIHGGPTGIDRPTPIYGGVYPVNQWLYHDGGALVLRVNYRGSAGYGADFRALNVRNLGVGDAWDVLSGVDYLDEQGMIDTDRMGCMGWSQGGYISAFLTTHTDRFAAISVGAGISNWMTYYVNTDIHPFTRQYLQATPWEDPEIYAKTSPMTTINEASTPTLIQHGEFDQRVPIANAYELVQGLRDNDVPAKLIVYKGFGHGISKPKERLAALWHNWAWFGEYVWGDEVEVPGME
jgi:dipeptidyl aminopeptidase/acylaminoacyl peptidase